MRHKLTLGLVALLLLAGTPSRTSAATILSFETMAGVDGAFVGHNKIRGIIGDELPWEIETAVGSLSDEGHLVVSVTGLVFKDDPSVPPNLRGINDEETFRAVVSCLTQKPSEKGKVTVVNLVTAGFPATPSGDSNIDATVTLPNPCVAPIIFILSGSEDKWFSVTGSEED